MKVIFLDVDGVLNCASTEDRAPSYCIGVESRCVKALRRIVEATGAKIVLTSTWKEEWWSQTGMITSDFAYLMQELAKEGLSLFSKTEDDITHRGAGICAWLNTHEVSDWVVLDDEVYIDFDHYPSLMSRLIRTSYGGSGLTEELAARAIQILNRVQEEKNNG